MSLLNVDTIEPEGATTVLTLGSATDTIKIPGGSAGADKVLTSDATGGATWAAASAGGLLGLVVYTNDGTYSPGDTDNGTAGDEGSASVTKVIIEVQGGGGGGGRGTGGTYVIGGSGGGYAKKFIDVSAMKTAEESATITVGNAGVGKATTSGAGGDAGDSSWVSTGEVNLTVTGEKGVGAYASYGSAVGGDATNGDINIKGGDGVNSIPARAGSSMLGSGGANGWVGETTPGTGRGYGSGGGGGYTTNGADGAIGIVLIWEYA